jgi:hypothetical protein
VSGNSLSQLDRLRAPARAHSLAGAFLSWRPLFEHSRSLTDRQMDARAMPYRLRENRTPLSRLLPVHSMLSTFACRPWSTSRPCRSCGRPRRAIVGLFVRPISHYVQSSSSSRHTAGAAGFLILSQCADRPRTVWRPKPLGHDALTAERAGMLEMIASSSRQARCWGVAAAAVRPAGRIRSSMGSCRISSPFTPSRSNAHRIAPQLRPWPRIRWNTASPLSS